MDIDAAHYTSFQRHSPRQIFPFLLWLEEGILLSIELAKIKTLFLFGFGSKLFFVNPFFSSMILPRILIVWEGQDYSLKKI
jgi:hypothetical protein